MHYFKISAWGIVAAWVMAPLSVEARSPLQPPPIKSGETYVAMGSSFAAGPGVSVQGVAIDGAIEESGKDKRCGRSPMNYASQLAKMRGLKLVDVSCSGARTDHITGAWAELPAQVEAISADTRLVTVTIGGNDLGYVGMVLGASCREDKLRSGGDLKNCFKLSAPSEAAFAHTEAGLRAIAAEVKKRAPKARLIFVEYLELLPKNGDCAALPMATDDAHANRLLAARLAAITQKIAQDSGAEFLPLSRLSRGHDACAAEPWVNGLKSHKPNYASAHPNLAGMTAIAKMLDKKLGRAARL